MSVVFRAPRTIGIAALLCGTASCTGPARGAARDGFDPARPGASGYRLVFDEPFATPARVDLAGENAGTIWFRQPFFGWKPSPPGTVRLADGVLELGGPGGGGSVALARPVPGAAGWRGRVFGGGFLMEARIALGPIVPEDGWPAVWSMAIEHMAARGHAQVPGKPAGYERFIENDFFEADTGYAGRDTYGTALHDWTGQFRLSCPDKPFCRLTNNGRDAPRGNVARGPRGIDWGAFHVVAQHWRPATASRPGFVQNYLDGRPTTRTEWQRHDPAAAVPPTGGQVFSIMDEQRLVVVLNGSRRILRVDWLRVWQPRGATAEIRTTSAAD